MLPMTELTLSPGVTLRVVQTKKFKTSLLAVTFVEPLTAEHAALHALLPKVLHRGTQAHPDMQALSAALDELYGGSIQPILRKKGEVQCIGFWGSFLDEAFSSRRHLYLRGGNCPAGRAGAGPGRGEGNLRPRLCGQ